MKGVISFLFVCLFAGPAFAGLSCDILFDVRTSVKTTDHDYYVRDMKRWGSWGEEQIVKVVESKNLVIENPDQTSNRKYLINEISLQLPIIEKSNFSKEKKNLKKALLLYEMILLKTSSIRRLSKKIYKADFDNFTTTQKRLRTIEAGILLRIAEFLAARGINYFVKEDAIFISPNGNHYLNKIVNRINQKDNLVVGIGARELLEHGALGLHHSEKNRILVSPEILLLDTKLQDATLLHEYRHYLNRKMARNGILKPYMGYIFIDNPSSEGTVSGYTAHFSIDEITAFRASMRASVHKAITKNGILERYLDLEIGHEGNSIVGLADITRKVFKQYLEDGKPASNLVKFPDGGAYRIEIEKGQSAEEIYKYAEDSYQFYSFVLEQWGKFRGPRNQIKMLKRIAILLSSVNNTTEYPSLEETKKLLSF